jgi:TetR/AcrR family transcriptional repressor of mexJK operon
MSAQPVPVSSTCRERLILAASQALMEEGYRASVDRIAALAGVAKQTLYNHFTSKEELYTEVGASLADQAAVELRAADNEKLRDTLIRFGLDIRQRALNDSAIALFRVFHGEGGRFPETGRALHARAVKRLREHIADVLTQAAKRGEVKVDDPAFAASMLMGMLVEVDRIARLTGGHQLESKREKQRVVQIVDCFLRAFHPTL